jgi:hypothetical protein
MHLGKRLKEKEKLAGVAGFEPTHDGIRIRFRSKSSLGCYPRIVTLKNKIN